MINDCLEWKINRFLIVSRGDRHQVKLWENRHVLATGADSTEKIDLRL